LLPRRVALRQVRTDHLPALTAVDRAVNVLAAGVDRVVIVRRNRQRERPVEPVLRTGGSRADGHLGPDFHLARLAGALVEPLDGATEAAETSARRPDDVGVDRIGDRPPTLAAGDRVPHAAGNRPGDGVLRLLGDAAVARAAGRWPVLAVAVDVVRNLVVGG